MCNHAVNLPDCWLHSLIYRSMIWGRKLNVPLAYVGGSTLNSYTTRDSVWLRHHYKWASRKMRCLDILISSDFYFLGDGEPFVDCVRGRRRGHVQGNIPLGVLWQWIWSGQSWLLQEDTLHLVVDFLGSWSQGHFAKLFHPDPKIKVIPVRI